MQSLSQINAASGPLAAFLLATLWRVAITTVTGPKTKKQPTIPNIHLRLQFGKEMRRIALITQLFTAIRSNIRG